MIMQTELFLKYYKGANFFPDYAPGVTNWAHKMRGSDGHGKPITFTAPDFKEIRRGMDTLKKEITGIGGKKTRR